MSKRFSRSLLVGAFLSASLALGVAPSYAQMNPSDAGISDADCERVHEIGVCNNAYMEFVDDSGQPTLVFTGANFPNELRWPSDFTGFDNPDLQQLWLQHSQLPSNEAVNSIVDDVVTQVTNANYTATAACNPDTDVVDLTTMAPSSVTSPLVTEYGSLINIIAADPQSEASGGKAHAPKAKHAPKKNATKESTATPAAAQVIEVPVTLVKPQ